MAKIFIAIFSFCLLWSGTGLAAKKVVLHKDFQDRWQLLVDGELYFIRGVVYEPIKIGTRLNSSNQWMTYDFNKDGRNDCAYESWVDKNRNNVQDPDEPVVGDFQLLKEMGVNTIRIYHPTNIDKKLLSDLYERYGIMVIMGNFFGAYTWGSGADWEKGTDYTNSKHCKNMLRDVEKMVNEYKNEPYILAWVLGNENDMEGSYENSTFNNTNARRQPKAFTKFLNKVARRIHRLDPNHPVGVSHASYLMLPYYKKMKPEIDFLGFNRYDGPHGFGTLFNTVKFYIDKPVVLLEYGVDTYDQNKKEENETYQALYHRKAWRDIVANHEGKAKNAIGGTIYTWLDSWWLSGSPNEHDTEKGAWQGPTKDAWFHDEWLGITSQGDGSVSPVLRQLREAYYFYQKEWTNEKK
jgi:glycosyl hydrolase family 2